MKLITLLVVATTCLLACSGNTHGDQRGWEHANQDKSAQSEISSTLSSGVGIIPALLGSIEMPASEARDRQALQAFTESYEVTMNDQSPCDSGSIDMDGEGFSDFDYDDETGEFQSGEMNFTIQNRFDDCVFEEGDSGSSSLAVTINGEISMGMYALLDKDNVTMDVSIDGQVKFDLEDCSEGADLELVTYFMFEGKADQNPEEMCQGVWGYIKGDVCGSKVDCEVSGDCEEPSFTGTNCE